MSSEQIILFTSLGSVNSMPMASIQMEDNELETTVNLTEGNPIITMEETGDNAVPGF